MADIDKIKWREVPKMEYGGGSMLTPRRITVIDNKQVRWETGVFPTELPIKTGAVVAPVAPNEYGFVPYVLGPSGMWFELQREDDEAYPTDKSDIINYINEGTFYIAFGGYDD